MRIAFLGLPESERRLYIEEAAARRGGSAVIIEKDLWVDWVALIGPPVTRGWKARPHLEAKDALSLTSNCVAPHETRRSADAC